MGLLMLATVALGAYHLITTGTPPTGSGPEKEPHPKEVAPRAAIPPGWTEFAPDDGAFRAYLPTRPREQRPAESESAVYVASSADGTLACMITVQRLAGDIPDDQRDAIAEGLVTMTARSPNREVGRKVSSLAGRRVMELVVELPGATETARPQMVVRAVRVGGRVYSLAITGAAGRPDSAIAEGFFDHFEPGR